MYRSLRKLEPMIMNDEKAGYWINVLSLYRGF